MFVKNLLSTLIGVWFFFTPWIFGYAINSMEAYICFILGGVQSICSLLALVKPGKKRWINGLPVLIGIWFIIFPNAYNLQLTQIVVLEVLGLVTILLNYALIFPESQ